MPGYLRPDTGAFLDEQYFDSVNKLRNSSPQALVDTDFEYGMQISKWENLGLMNNRPFAYPSSNTIPNITAIVIPQNSTTVTVTTGTTPHGLTVGTPVNVQDTFLSIGNGNFIIESIPTPTTFTYTARSINISSTINEIFDSNKTALYIGTAYTDSEVGGTLTLSCPPGSREVTVTTTVPHGLSLGSEIAISGITITSPLTKTATGTSGALTITVNNNTSIIVGMSIAGAGIAPQTLVTSINENIIGLSRALTGNLSTTSVAFTNPPNGSFYVARVTNSTNFVYYAKSIPTGTLAGTAKLYVRPQAQFLHRPFDGGVLFSANASSNNQQAVRQTRRYFRYQSGKGMQISSGTVLKPNLSIESLTSAGNIITVQTKEQHNLQPGSTVKIFGANEPDYNGEFTIIEILGYNLFQVLAPTSPLQTKASGNYYVTIDTWYGCSNLIGMFDSQNGVFFEFDGQQLYVVRRSSTYQISGKVTVENGSNSVTQTNAAFPTNFSRQLDPGDFIVIRGQSYRVEGITSDTTMTISPSYRGASAQYSLVAKTVDTKIPQSDWNLDTMDGRGPSGYDLDLTKMQMFYIDYSWYGAGYIRWGLRGVDGDITPVHKLANNNVNAEAYMRSGNIPARYESNTFAKTTKANPQIPILITSTTLNVDNTDSFPDSGTLLIRGGTVYEYVNYTGKTATSFTGVIRERSGATIDVTIAAGSNIGTVLSTTGIQVGQRVIHPNFPENSYVSEIDGASIKFNTAAIISNPTNVIFSPMATGTPQAFAPTTLAPVSLELAYPTFSASISHWGTSVIMDGGFDDDKSLLFTYGQTKSTTVPAAPASPISTTATGSAGSKEFLVASPTGITVGMLVAGVGVQTNSVVTNISGNVVSLSLSLIEELSDTAVQFSGGNSKALFSIRVAPSVDNGISANFGQRELINRMQLTLKSLGVITSSESSKLLVTAILNGVPTSATLWENVVRGSNVLTNSSLSQIADYSDAENTIILGGEITGGFYSEGTSSIDLEDVRDLGNSILGGGTSFADANVYPDGPDVLSIVVTNLSSTEVEVLGRLSWKEAQA